MSWVTCWKCKERFGLDDATEATLRKSGGSFCCPWGHSAVFSLGPTEEDKLRQERDRLKQREAQLRDEVSAQREAKEAAERRASAARGQVTKLKKRAANGVCPCCNRTFVDLQRHMASKHAGFLTEEVQGEAGQVH